MGNLPLRAIDSNLIAGLFGAREIDLAIVFLFELVDLGKTGNEFSVVKSVDAGNLSRVFRVLGAMVSSSHQATIIRGYLQLGQPFQESHS